MLIASRQAEADRCLGNFKLWVQDPEEFEAIFGILLPRHAVPFKKRFSPRPWLCRPPKQCSYF